MCKEAANKLNPDLMMAPARKKEGRGFKDKGVDLQRKGNTALVQFLNVINMFFH